MWSRESKPRVIEESGFSDKCQGRCSVKKHTCLQERLAARRIQVHFAIYLTAVNSIESKGSCCGH